jgi:hypothetical protein
MAEDKIAEVVVTEIVKSVITDFVIPKIKNVFSNTTNKKKEKNITDNFDEYLTQRYVKYSFIDTLVFPNKQTLLKTLYEPLTIRTDVPGSHPIEIVINKYPNKLLNDFCRIIIEDTAGMGKSTISKWLFLSIIDQNEGIPILIELRHINSHNSILKEIQHQLSGIGSKISINSILALISDGKFVFLFDGFDEVANSDRAYVNKELKLFTEKADNNFFIITSRTEDSLSSFGDFKKFSINPLEKKQACSLFKKYDKYSHKPIADDLIDQLNNTNNEILREYLKNPLLVSLLYKSFEFGKDIPVKKSQFYGLVFDALFQNHDLSKEGYLKRDKASNLHIDDFERVLRYVAYLTSIENKVNYDKNYIVNIIQGVKNILTDLDFKPTDFLKDLLTTVPIFKQDGNYYTWSHKSLQDYFSAKFLWIDAKQSQISILEKIYNEPNNRRFYNILDIFFELDPQTFETTILYWILAAFKKHKDSSYINFDHIDSTIVSQRIESTFNNQCYFIVLTPEDTKIGGEVDSNLVLKYESKIPGMQGFNWNSVYFFEIEDSGLQLFVYHRNSSNIVTILDLLKSRMPDLISRTSFSGSVPSLSMLSVETPYQADWDQDNILNKSKYFKLFTSLISENIQLKIRSLDKLTEIEKKRQLGDENIFLKW